MTREKTLTGFQQPERHMWARSSPNSVSLRGFPRTTLCGMTRSNKTSPQNRGLIVAVTLFALCVLGGTALMMHRGESLEKASTRIEALIPEAVRRTASRTAHDPVREPAVGEGEKLAGDAMDFKERLRKSRGAVVGRPTVIRGDLIQVDGETIRLMGVDEIRGFRHCSPNGFGWQCGTSSAGALALLLGDKKVACEPKGRNAQGETVAICFLGNTDIAAEMLLRGMVINVTDRFDYKLKQNMAKADRVGYWQVAQK